MLNKHLHRLITKLGINLVLWPNSSSKEKSIHRFSKFLKFYNVCTNVSLGGKLWVLWQDEHLFVMDRVSDQMIMGWMMVNGVKILISFVYARCSMHERIRLWTDLEGFANTTFSWLVVGDFNSIISDSKRIAGQRRPLVALTNFNNCIDSCGLVELSSTGGSMSWSNGQGGSN